MNICRLHTVLFRPHSRSFACLMRPRSRSTVIQGRRRYATHRDSLPSSLLTSALDQKQRGAQRDESVGPFQLDIQPSIRRGEKVKKWSELSTGGKGMIASAFLPICDIDLAAWAVTRAAARSTNLTVILLGAGFSVMLIYALTSELFSPNSPTVLYGRSCDRIKASKKVLVQEPSALEDPAYCGHRLKHICRDL